VETIAVALFLLLAVVVSGALARMSPVPLPLPLVQIALGAVVASVANLGVELKPDIFFLLFLPPLLFHRWMAYSQRGIVPRQRDDPGTGARPRRVHGRRRWLLRQLDDPGHAVGRRLCAGRDRLSRQEPVR